MELSFKSWSCIERGSKEAGGSMRCLFLFVRQGTWIPSLPSFPSFCLSLLHSFIPESILPHSHSFLLQTPLRFFLSLPFLPSRNNETEERREKTEFVSGSGFCSIFVIQDKYIFLIFSRDLMCLCLYHFVYPFKAFPNLASSVSNVG